MAVHFLILKEDFFITIDGLVKVHWMQNTVRFRGHQTIRHPRSFQDMVF